MRVRGMQPGPGEAIAAPTTEPVPVAAPPAGNGATGPVPPPEPAPSWGALRRPGVLAAIAGAVVVIGVGAWWLFFRDGGSTSSALTLTKSVSSVIRGPMDTTVSADGTVAAAQTDNLNFSAAGQVTAVNVKAGDKVTAGQVLATLDSASLQASVATAESQLASAQASLSDNEAAGASSAQIAADEASVTSAGDSLSAAQANLAGANLVATFDGTVTQVNLTVGEQLTTGGSGGTGTTGTGSGSGQSSSNLASGSNGFGGLGGNANASSNSNSSSSSSSPQIEVASTGRYTVDLDVSSSDVGQVKVGQTATLTPSTSSGNGFRGFGGGGFGGLFGGRFGGAATGNGAANGNGGTNGNGGSGAANATAGGASATGLVSAVSQVATASSGVATYPVTITFDADPSSFFVGGTVTGAITVASRPDVLQVPSRAITTVNGISTVSVATNGTANGPTQLRSVETGLTQNGQTEITSGVREGEKVIVLTPQLAGGFRLPGAGTGTSTGGGGFGGFGGAGGGGFRVPGGGG